MTAPRLALSWLAGVVAAHFALEGQWAPVALAAIVALVPLLRRRRIPLAAAAAALFALGAARFALAQPDPPPLAAYNDAAADADDDVVDVTVRGVVSREPDLRGTSLRLWLDAEEILTPGGWAETDGGLLVTTTPRPLYAYGDLLEVSGELETPPVLEDFDYREYLARQGVYSTLRYPRITLVGTGQGRWWQGAVGQARRFLGEGLAESLPEPQAALAQGVFLGQRSALPPELRDDLNATGTSHLIVVSGYNVSLVAGMVTAGLAWMLGRRGASVVTLGAIAAYAVLTGADPPVVRAAVMGGLFVVAGALGRESSAGPSLMLAAAAMTAVSPLIIEDISFQLSVAATAGLILLASPLAARLRARFDLTQERLVAGLLEVGVVTVSAIVATLPLTALNFQRLSLSAFPANLVLVPLFPATLGTSAVASLAGHLPTPAQEVLAAPAWLLLLFFERAARFFADAPASSITITKPELWQAGLAYGVLALLAWRTTRPHPPETTRRALSGAPALRAAAYAAVGAVLVAANVGVWEQLFEGEGETLRVEVLDVGQGDAIFIQGPGGHRLLVDGGPDGERLLTLLGDRIPFGDRRIDLLVLTNLSADHLAGLFAVVERYQVGAALVGGIDEGGRLADLWFSELQAAGVPLYRAVAGQSVDLGQGAVVQVLHPPGQRLSGTAEDENNNSAVLLLRYGAVAFLLTGDLEREGEVSLLLRGLPVGATVLKVGHHGAANATLPDFLAAVRPAVAAISAGAHNPFGHPRPETLQKLAAVGARIYRTDEDGTIRFETDGETLTVATER